MCGLRRCLLLLAAGLPAAGAEVQVKILKDMNIGYGHGSGTAKPLPTLPSAAPPHSPTIWWVCFNRMGPRHGVSS